MLWLLQLHSGPNTALGHSSVISMIEAQSDYASRCIKGCIDRRIAAMDIKPEASAAYNSYLQKELAKCVWTGCNSWYKLENSKNVTLWPHTVWRYWRQLSTIPWGSYATA
jgi:hypothetical protein